MFLFIYNFPIDERGSRCAHADQPILCFVIVGRQATRNTKTRTEDGRRGRKQRQKAHTNSSIIKKNIPCRITVLIREAVIILPVVMVDMEAHRMEAAAAVHTAEEEQVHMAAEAVRVVACFNRTLLRFQVFVN